jgi:alkanesulfonate monooxygenase SsuD/methylene tetrahydromethanopterin reductase-like flavin-dependent oxidoreductase (luciferase family)
MKYSIFCLVDHFHDDERGIPTQYNEVLEQIRVADKLGYETFWLAEHHFENEHGSVASPAVFLAAAARETEQIGLGCAVSVLPLHNPVRVAEDFALLDILSGGRMRFCVGSGYLEHEYAGFNIKFEERVPRLNESLALIQQLWSEPEVCFKGEFFEASKGLNIRPVSAGRPMMAVVRREAAAAMGAKGYPIFMSSLSVKSAEAVRDVVDSYREAYLENGHAPEELHIAYCINLVLDHDGEAARQQGFAGVAKLFAHRGVRRTPENFHEAGLCFFGTPQEAVEAFKIYMESGVTELAVSVAFGGLEHETSMQTLRLFQEEVLPQLHPESTVGRVQ